MDIMLVVAFLIIFLSAIVSPVLTFLIISRIDFKKDKETVCVQRDYITAKGRMA